jgi:pimeloyl-ACP methyl ester carboxylesterase
MIQSFPGLMGLALTGVPLGDPALPASSDMPGFGVLGENEPTDDQVEAFLRISLGDHDEAFFARAVKRADPRAMNRIASDIGSNGGDLWPSVASVSAVPVMIVNGARGAPAEALASASAGRGVQMHYAVPHAGPAPFLDVPVVYNHLLQRFMQRMTRRERNLLASPTLWYGG